MVRSKPLRQIKDKTVVLADRKWRMENLGMVADSHHLCVALTRARFGLVIIGEFPCRFPSANTSVLLYLSLLQLCTYQCVNVGVQACRTVNCVGAFDAVHLPLQVTQPYSHTMAHGTNLFAITNNAGTLLTNSGLIKRWIGPNRQHENSHPLNQAGERDWLMRSRMKSWKNCSLMLWRIIWGLLSKAYRRSHECWSNSRGKLQPLELYCFCNC